MRDRKERGEIERQIMSVDYHISMFISIKKYRNECPAYDTKQSDGEVPVTPDLCGMQSTLFIAISPRFTLVWSGST